MQLIKYLESQLMNLCLKEKKRRKKIKKKKEEKTQLSKNFPPFETQENKGKERTC